LECEDTAKCLGILIGIVIVILYWPVVILIGGAYIIYKLCLEKDDYCKTTRDTFSTQYDDDDVYQPSIDPSPDYSPRRERSLFLDEDWIYVSGKSGCVVRLEEMGYIEKEQFTFTVSGITEKREYIQQLLAENKDRTDSDWKDRIAPTLLGALGEINTLLSLAELRGSFIVINNLELYFHRPFRNKLDDGSIDYVKSSQIDHVVIGPTGVYAIESKNWSAKAEIREEYSPIMQARRCGKAIWYFLKKETGKAFNVKTVISMTGSAAILGSSWVTVLPANRIRSYITRGKTQLTNGEIERIAQALL
jgi:hypothetical protein